MKVERFFYFKHMECIEINGYKFKKTIGTSSVPLFCIGRNCGYVYLLVYFGQIVYIGASGDRQRIGKHQRDKLFDTVYYCEFTDNKHWQVETDLIKKLKPLYNKRLC